MKRFVPIARSDIHVHLQRDHVEALFGRGYRLTNLRDLTIPGQFCCNEQVTVVGPAGSIEGVYVVGPPRSQTQVEISFTNGLTLGIAPPLRYSGDLDHTPGCTLIGPAGSVTLSQGVIAARRHIHMHTSEAQAYGITDGQLVKVLIPGDRALIFNDVKVLVGDNQALEMHVDFDEGHAAGIEDFQEVEILL
ncbi:MAG: phosphate propanoyltransferase [Spirochaetales bacterium]|nr:phosphate propanoyltransferase [Spirochaetales bacterium]